MAKTVVVGNSADEIKGTPVNDTDKAANKMLKYNSETGNLEYERMGEDKGSS